MPKVVNDSGFVWQLLITFDYIVCQINPESLATLATISRSFEWHHIKKVCIPQ